MRTAGPPGEQRNRHNEELHFVTSTPHRALFLSFFFLHYLHPTGVAL